MALCKTWTSFFFFNEYGENWLESAAAHCRQVMISRGFYVEAR